MPTSKADILALARSAIEAGQSGDYETLRGLYAPGARLWANTTGTWKTIEEHLASVEGQRSAMQNIRYAEPRIAVFEEGYVQQFRVQAEAAHGVDLDIPACQVVQVRDGRIVQREEYMDSASLTTLVKK